MDQKINECLTNRHGSYILPFLRLHGEPHERLYEEILAIKNSGISEFCAESRPYKFDLSDALCDGENGLRIPVRSNLAHHRRDDLSKDLQIPPTGIVGDTALCRYEVLYTL